MYNHSIRLIVFSNINLLFIVKHFYFTSTMKLFQNLIGKIYSRLVKLFQRAPMRQRDFAYYGLTAFMTALTGITAQIRFYVGPIPFTMQNFAVILSGLLLPPFYALLSQLLYLSLIALGIPLASNFSGGLGVLLGYTAGYLWGFPITAFLMSILSRYYLSRTSIKLTDLRGRDMVVLLGLSLIAALPLYALGYIVFLYYALPGTKLYSWATSISSKIGLVLESRLLILFLVSVVIFVPQDLFMDHLLAIITAKGIARILYVRGLSLN